MIILLILSILTLIVLTIVFRRKIASFFINLSVKNKILSLISIFIITIGHIYITNLSYGIANYKFKSKELLKLYQYDISIKTLFTNDKQTFLYLTSMFLLILFIYYIFKSANSINSKGRTVEITPDIIIPVKAGEGQFGTASFLKDKDLDKVFKSNIIDFNDKKLNNILFELKEDYKNELSEISKKLNNEDINEIKKQLNELKINNGAKYDIKYNKIDSYKISIQQELKKQLNEINFKYQNVNLENVFNYLNEESIKNNDIESLIQNKIKKNNIDIENIEEQFNKALNTKDEFNNYYIDEKIDTENNDKNVMYNRKNDDKILFQNGAGIIVNVTKGNSFEKYNFIDSNTHSLTLGATRSGKSRCDVMPTMGLMGLAGESIVVTDPKGELYQFTNKFFKNLNYDIVCLDFKNPNKSSKYNLLQPVINAYKEKNIDKAVNYALEIAEILVGDTKGEKIWEDGQKAAISGAILSVISENIDIENDFKNANYELMNFSNVYRMIGEGAGKTIDNKQCDLAMYINDLICRNPTHPSIDRFSPVINSADNTRLSFIASALTTLNLFSTPSMWQVTHKTDIDLTEIGEKKMVLYIILPDEDTKYYKIASLIVSLLYNELCKKADFIYGGILPNRVNFLLDEFGNFTKIPAFDAKLTVGGGRRIRLNMYIQAFAQLVKVYEKETCSIIKSNCETWKYLQCDELETLKELSEKLGKYTIETNSTSQNSTSNIKNSMNTSLTGRNLLFPEEIKAIKRPYELVMSRNKPAVTKCYDISQLCFNKYFNMGDEDHNAALRIIREKNRKSTEEEYNPKYWQPYKEIIINKIQNAISFAKKQLEEIDDDEIRQEIVKMEKELEEKKKEIFLISGKKI